MILESGTEINFGDLAPIETHEVQEVHFVQVQPVQHDAHNRERVDHGPVAEAFGYLTLGAMAIGALGAAIVNLRSHRRLIKHDHHDTDQN